MRGWWAVISTIVLALAGAPMPARGARTPCPPALYTLDPAGATAVGTILGAPADELAIGPVGEVRIADCETTGRVKAKKKATNVSARWETCGVAIKVRLSAKIPAPDCASVSGKLKAKHAGKAKFTATRLGGLTTTTTGGVTTTSTTAPTVTTTSTTLTPSASMQLLPASTTLSRGDVGVARIAWSSSAPEADTVVDVSSSAPGVVAVPAQIVVPGGQGLGFLALQSGQPGTATLTATAAGFEPASATMQVVDRGFSVSLGRNALNAGAQVTATVTLSSPAPAGDASLNIASSDTSALSVSPALLIVPTGELQATFTLSGVAAGSADVTISAVSGTVGSQTVHLGVESAATDDTQTSEMLIETARAAGQITDEQALVYRVYAVFGSNQLPVQYRGRIDVLLDSSLRVEIGQRWPSLSLEAKIAITPFAMPPIYSGSWGDPAVRDGVNPAAKIQRSRVRANATLLAPAAATPTDPNPCSSVDPPLPGTLPGWGHLDTQHFRLWYRTASLGIGKDYYTVDQGIAAAGNVAAIAEEVHASLVSVMGRAPLPDTTVACNGGDSRLDIYLDRESRSMVGQVLAYPGGCNQAPAYMWMSPDDLLDPKYARDVFAHEFLHMIQLSYAKGADCNGYGWLDEGTANWAIEYVYHADDFEHRYSWGYFGQTEAGVLGLSIPIDLQALFTDHPLCRNGYCSYPLFEYITKRFGDDRIRRTYEASELFDAIGSIDAGLGSGTSLRDVWHDFSLTAYNDFRAGVKSDFFGWDMDPAGFRSTVFDPRLGPTVVEASLKGGKEADLTDDLAAAFAVASVAQPGNRPIYRLSNRVVDIRFTDSDVSYILFQNPAGGIPGLPGIGGINDPNLKIWAIRRMNGTWRQPEDWTHVPLKVYCRDKTDEHLEELVLIYSNGNTASRGQGTSGSDWFIDLDPQNDSDSSMVPHLFVSNVGCFRWKGTSKVTVTDASGGVQEANAEVTYEVDPDFPGTSGLYWAKYYQPFEGSVTLQGHNLDFGCPTDIQMISQPLGASDTLDNEYIYIDYAKPAGDDERGHAFGRGQSTIANATLIMHCEDGDHVLMTDVFTDWLDFDFELPPTGAQVSDDGRTMSGSRMFTDPGTGDQWASEWNLEAQTE